jgi:hypothetical protein
VSFAPYSRSLEGIVLVPSVDGRQVTDPKYPSAVTLSLIYREATMNAEALDFLRYMFSPKAGTLIRKFGGVPVASPDSAFWIAPKQAISARCPTSSLCSKFNSRFVKRRQMFAQDVPQPFDNVCGVGNGLRRIDAHHEIGIQPMTEPTGLHFVQPNPGHMLRRVTNLVDDIRFDTIKHSREHGLRGLPDDVKDRESNE